MDVRVWHRLTGRRAVVDADCEGVGVQARLQLFTGLVDQPPQCGLLGGPQGEDAGDVLASVPSYANAMRVNAKTLVFTLSG